MSPAKRAAQSRSKRSGPKPTGWARYHPPLGLWVLLAAALAGAAIWGLATGPGGGHETPASATSEIGDESREALREILREADRGREGR